MKQALFLAALVALVLPLAAQARHDDSMRVRLLEPVTFSDPTPSCPNGIANYGISVGRKTGTGANCISPEIPVDCPAGSGALFCQNVPVLTSLRLPGGKLDANVTIFETWTCLDPPDCTSLSVDQQWRGRVTRATGVFNEVRHGSVSGGGTFAFSPTSFLFDETLLIGEGDDD
jgi:hypothetical protein